MSKNFGGRHHVKCTHCEKYFARGKDHRGGQVLCKDCEVVGWLDEMSRQGCNVVAERRLGQQPIAVAKQIGECPTITVGGVVYRDTTDLLYEDTKHKKLYAGDQQYERHERYRRREVMQRKKKDEKLARRIMPADYLKANEETGYIDEYVIENRGKITQAKMAENLGVQTSVISTVVRKLADEGKIRITYVPYLGEEKEMIKRLYLCGMFPEAISVEVNKRFKNERTRRGISNFLQREGIRRGK